MRFLETILMSNRTQRNGSVAGEDAEAADGALYGPMVFRRPVPTHLVPTHLKES